MRPDTKEAFIRSCDSQLVFLWPVTLTVLQCCSALLSMPASEREGNTVTKKSNTVLYTSRQEENIFNQSINVYLQSTLKRPRKQITVLNDKNNIEKYNILQLEVCKKNTGDIPPKISWVMCNTFRSLTFLGKLFISHGIRSRLLQYTGIGLFRAQLRTGVQVLFLGQHILCHCSFI